MLHGVISSLSKLKLIFATRNIVGDGVETESDICFRNFLLGGDDQIGDKLFNFYAPAGVFKKRFFRSEFMLHIIFFSMYNLP